MTTEMEWKMMTWDKNCLHCFRGSDGLLDAAIEHVANYGLRVTLDHQQGGVLTLLTSFAVGAERQPHPWRSQCSARMPKANSPKY